MVESTAHVAARIAVLQTSREDVVESCTGNDT